MKFARKYLSLGERFEERGKYVKAERLYVRALKLIEGKVDATSEELIPYLYNLGYIQAAQDHNSESVKTFGRLLPILLKKHGQSHIDVQEIRDVLDVIHAEIGIPSQAING